MDNKESTIDCSCYFFRITKSGFDCALWNALYRRHSFFFSPESDCRLPSSWTVHPKVVVVARNDEQKDGEKWTGRGSGVRWIKIRTRWRRSVIVGMERIWAHPKWVSLPIWRNRWKEVGFWEKNPRMCAESPRLQVWYSSIAYTVFVLLFCDSPDCCISSVAT